MLRRLTMLVVAIPAVLALWVSQAGAGQDPRQQQEQVRQQKAQAARDVNALQADAAQVQQALADLQSNVSGQEALLGDATIAARQAEAAAAQARANADAAAARVVELRSRLRGMAVDAYVQGPSPRDDGAGDPNQAVLREALLSFRAADETQVLDELRAAEEDATAQRAIAEEQAAVAEQKRGEIAQRVGQVRAARDQQAGFASQVQARLDQRLAEAAGLEALDRNLAAQITAQEVALAQRVPTGGGGGSPSPQFAPFPLTTVRGITVASSIAGQLSALLDAADAAGISLGGSGYRDPAQQQALRNRNCPDPANSPPSACRPPTARAGTSMHEQGVAVDFTQGGTVLSTGSSGYQWLSGNAGQFGFYNLPGEPWHWSVNGR